MKFIFHSRKMNRTVNYSWMNYFDMGRGQTFYHWLPSPVKDIL